MVKTSWFHYQGLRLTPGQGTKSNHFGKQFGEFLKIKLDILILYNVAIVLLGIYSKELKTYVHTKTHN